MISYINVIIISLICLFLLFILFHHYYSKKNNEKYTSYYHNIDSKMNTEITLIIETILQNLKQKLGLNLIMGDIVRVEKTMEEKGINYDINVFIYNTTKNITKKLNFDVTINNKTIYLNNIKNGESRDILIEERGGVSSRGSTVYKPSVDMKLVKNNDNITFDYSNVYYPSKDRIKIDRNKTILPETYINNNSLIYPLKNINKFWDKFGVNLKSESESDMKLKNSYNYGFRKRNIVPNFFINNFSEKSGDYHYLFDLTQDSASRPIGITGARG